MLKKSVFLTCSFTLLTFTACKDRGTQSEVSEDSGLPTTAATALNVAARIPVSGDWMCLGFGSLWEPSDPYLVRVDPATHAVQSKVEVSGNFCHADPLEKVMWVASVYDDKIFKIDIAKNKVVATFNVKITSGSEASFAVTSGAIWVITSEKGTQSGTLTRIDTKTGAVAAHIKVANDSHGIAATKDSIWVTSASDNSVTQVDITSNSVKRTIKVDENPRFISADENGVWTLCQGSGSVAHIDTKTGALIANIVAKASGFGGGISVGEGAVWLTMPGKPVIKIDPQTNQVITVYKGSGFGDAIIAGEGYVWVSGSKLAQITPP